MNYRARLHRALDHVLSTLAERAAQDEENFKEADHPRRKDGKFGKGAGSASASPKVNAYGGAEAVNGKRGHAVNLGEVREALPKAAQIDITASDLGVSKPAAKKYVQAAALYSGSAYSDIRSGKDKATAKALEDYIARAPKWNGNGTVYRGITLSPEELGALSKGATLDMQGPSSWSSDESVSDGFAVGLAQHGIDDGRVPCVFQLPKMDKGTSIAHLSDMPLEAEVLASKDARYKVVGTTKKTIERNGRSLTVRVIKVEEV